MTPEQRKAVQAVLEHWEVGNVALPPLASRHHREKANAAFDALRAAFEATEWDRFQTWLDRIYTDFTHKVAEGRSIPIERVQEIARGRVWSGRDALALGLVDELGGIPKAVELAKEAAGIDSTATVRLRRFPRRPSFIDLIRDEATPESEWNAAVRAMDRVFEALGPMVATLERTGAVDGAPEPLLAPGVRELADIR